METYCVCLVLMPTPSSPTDDHCWVCGCLLADSGGDPSNIRESHHVVPQAYGGRDGPQVPLCLAHHDLLHLIAAKKISRKPHVQLLPVDKSLSDKLNYLSTVILDAHTKFSKDPNKKLTASVTLPKHQMDKLAKLARFLKVNRQSLLLKVVSDKYKEIFQEDF
jgi:hypothetical protein